MTKSKAEIIEKLKRVSGVDDPEWVSWPVHRLLAAIDDIKEAKRSEVLAEDFSSRITGTIKH
jgi:hypothetical protein